MARGGARPGSGRPVGSGRSLKARMRFARAEAKAANSGSAFNGRALPYLISVFSDESKPDQVRIEAAKTVVKYQEHQLSTITPSDVAKPDSDTIAIAAGTDLRQLARAIVAVLTNAARADLLEITVDPAPPSPNEVN